MPPQENFQGSAKTPYVTDASLSVLENDNSRSEQGAESMEVR